MIHGLLAPAQVHALSFDGQVVARIVACDDAPELVGRHVTAIDATWCPTWTPGDHGPLRCPLHAGHHGRCWAATAELIDSMPGPLAILAADT